MVRRATFALAVVLTALAALAAEPVDQRGQAHSIGGTSDRPTVVDFAASWCAPCWRSLPRLETLSKRHPRIRFVVVSVDEKVAGRDRLVERLGLELPVVWDEGQELAKRFRPAGMPTTLVLDVDGREIHRHSGSSEAGWQALEAVLANLDER